MPFTCIRFMRMYKLLRLNCVAPTEIVVISCCCITSHAWRCWKWSRRGPSHRSSKGTSTCWFLCFTTSDGWSDTPYKSHSRVHIKSTHLGNPYQMESPTTSCQTRKAGSSPPSSKSLMKSEAWNKKNDLSLPPTNKHDRENKPNIKNHDCLLCRK